MNRPTATRLGLSCIAVLVAAFAAFGPGFASGDVSSTATAWYGPTGATTLSPVPGSTTDYEIDQSFTYDNVDEDLKKWIVDSPAGLVGNPNAIPEAERCTMAQFDPSGTWGSTGDVSQAYPSLCPNSARVGFAKLYTASDGKAADGSTVSTGAGVDGPTGTIYPPAGTPLTPADGTIYLLKPNGNQPEVPTILATVVKILSYQPYVCAQLLQSVPCTAYRRTTSTLGPETNLTPLNNGDADFRIRTIPNEDVTRPVAFGPTYLGPTNPVSFPSYAHGGLKSHITRIDQHLFAYPNQDTSKPRFLTMPSRLDNWNSYSYSTAYDSNTNATLAMDPNHPTQMFSKSPADAVTPDQTKPDFNTTASASISTGERGAYPGLTVKVGDPSPSGNDQTKKLISTLPEAVSVNVKALDNVCTTAQRDSETCPAASQVGTATIATPLIQAGLTGKVYMVTGTTPGLPYLSIFVEGAIKFRLDATTKFVGSKFNIIETTFDDLPQLPFTDFTVNFTGGSSTSSLLFNRSCPTDGSSPAGGDFGFVLTGYADQTKVTRSDAAWGGCYGVNRPSSLKNCVKQSGKLKVSPKGLIDTAAIANVQLLTGSKSTNMKKRATDKTSPFSFKYTLKKSKFKKKTKYYYGYRVEYKDGKIVKTKSGTFKTCK